MLVSCLKRGQNTKESPWNNPADHSKLRNVTFADFAGQSLEAVKTITPNSSCEDLQSFPQRGSNFSLGTLVRNNDYKTLQDQGSIIDARANIVRISSSSLPQPLFGRDFVKLFERNSICLEHLFLASKSKNVLVGIVRVKNHAYEKDVFVKYTVNDWKDFHEKTAEFLFQCDEGCADKFVFQIAIPSNRLNQEAHGKIELAICCNIYGTLYWDNNGGRNYVVNY